MRDDGLRDAFFFAPCQLRSNRRMANERLTTPPNERARHSGAIANINLHVFQRRNAIMDKHKIRNIKNTRARSANAISNSWSEYGMFDWKCFECDPANFRRRALFDQTTVFDGVISQFSPGFLRRMHRTMRAFSQAPRVIRMRVRKNDRTGMQPLKFHQPIETAVDHYIGAAI